MGGQKAMVKKVRKACSMPIKMSTAAEDISDIVEMIKRGESIKAVKKYFT